MKKTEKLSILISIVLISLLAISAVSAAEADDTSATSTDDAPTITDTQDTAIAKESGSPAPVKEVETKTTQDESDTGTFTDLDKELKAFTTPEGGSNNITLQKKVYKYNSTIDEPNGLANGIRLYPSDPQHTELTINGNGAEIRGSYGASVFVFDSGINVIINNLNIYNTKKNQAAITVADADTSLTLNNVTFTNNGNIGLAIDNKGKLIISDSEFKMKGSAIKTEGNLDTLFNNAEEKLAEIDELSEIEAYLTELAQKATYVAIENTKFDAGDFKIEDENPQIFYYAIDATNTIVAIKDSTFIDSEIGIDAVNSSVFIKGTSFINNNASVLLYNSEFGMDDGEFINITDQAIFGLDSGIGLYNVEFTNNTDAIEIINSTIVTFNSAFTNITDAIDAEGSYLFVYATNFTNNDNPIDAFNSTVYIKDGFVTGNNGTISVFSELYIDGTQFIDNIDDAIDAFNSTIEISNAAFIGNDNAIDMILGTLDIENTNFINNTDTAISAIGANVTIDGGKFEGNNASDNRLDGMPEFLSIEEDVYGGAIYIEDGNLTINGGTEFTNNNAIFGGAIAILGEDSTLTINVEATFTGNNAIEFYHEGDEGYGGAIYNEGIATIFGEFINNTASENGGAIYNRGILNITGVFTGNEAENHNGGAIYNDESGVAIVSFSEFANNTADDQGGAIINKGLLGVVGSTFEDNEATDGGAIATASTGETFVEDEEDYSTSSKFISNLAENGGAIYNNGITYIFNSEFKENSADYGGAIYNKMNRDSYAMIIMDNTFTNDFAIINGTEIFTQHYNGDYYGHTRLIKLVGNIITNTYFDVYDSDYDNEIFIEEDGSYLVACMGCIEHEYNDYYFAIANFNYIILNNATGHLAIFFNLTDDFGEPYVYDALNITGDINDIAYSWVPYQNNTLFEVGEHTIFVEYGGDYSLAGYAPGYAIITFNLTQNVETLETIISGLEDYIDDLEDYIDELEQENLALKQNISDLKDEIDDLNIIIDILGDEIDDLNDQLTNASTKIDNLTKELEIANAKLEEAEKLNKDLRDQLTEKQAEIDAKQAEIAVLKNTIADLNSQLANATEEIANLTTKLNNTEKALNDTKAELANLTTTLNDTEKALNDTKAKLNETQTNLTKTQGALDEANKNLADKTAEAAAAQEQVGKLTTENNNLTIENKNLTSQATTANNNANAKIKKIKKPKSVKKSKKLKITVTLNKKVKGKYVYVVFNGKTYKAKTNSKGVAKITIKKSALKKLGGKKVKFPVIYNQSLKNTSVKIK